MKKEREIIYIETDDETPDIYDKIRGSKARSILLVIPEHTSVAHSIINLKLIKKKVEDLEKDLIIVTHDVVVRAICTKIDIPSVRTIKDAGGESLVEEKKEDVQIEEKGKHRKKQHRALTLLKQAIAQQIHSIEEERKKHHEDIKASKLYIHRKPNKKALGVLILVSCCLLLAISFLALPSATVTIRPTLQVKTTSTNVTFSTKSTTGAEDKVIPSKMVSADFERTISLPSSGGVFKGTLSHGTVTIYNNARKEWPLVANTRLVTKDGIVFLTTKFITVPAGKPITADVVSREKDEANAFIGERGNIAPTKLYFPALTEANRKLVWAENSEAFKGGSTVVERFVTPDDLKNAKVKIQNELDYASKDELNRAIFAQNETDKTSFTLFNGPGNTLKKDLAAIDIKATVNQKVDAFEVNGKMHASGLAVDEKMISDMLKKTLEEHLTPMEQLYKIDAETLQFSEVIDNLDREGTLKATASINGLLAYNFDETRINLSQTIRSNIVGKTKEEAQKYLLSLKEVNDVHISSWPFWLPTLPQIPENIKIEVSTVD